MRLETLGDFHQICIRLGLTEGKASEATSRCQIRWIHFDLSRPCSRCARHAASARDRRKTRLDAEATTRGGAGGPKCCCVLCHRCYRLILQRRLTCLFDQIRTMPQLLFIIWCTVQSVDCFSNFKAFCLSNLNPWQLFCHRAAKPPGPGESGSFGRRRDSTKLWFQRSSSWTRFSNNPQQACY